MQFSIKKLQYPANTAIQPLIVEAVNHAIREYDSADWISFPNWDAEVIYAEVTELNAANKLQTSVAGVLVFQVTQWNQCVEISEAYVRPFA